MPGRMCFPSNAAARRESGTDDSTAMNAASSQCTHIPRGSALNGESYGVTAVVLIDDCAPTPLLFYSAS